MATNGRVHPECINSSNPYHECGIACLEKIAKGEGKKLQKKKSGVSLLTATLSFNKKKKGTDSQPLSPQVASGYLSPRSPFSYRKKTESDNSQPLSLSQHFAQESYLVDHSLDKEQLRSSPLVPISGNLTPERPKSPANGSFTKFATNAPAKNEEVNGNLDASPKEATRAIVDFSFLGLSQSTGDRDDEEEIQSVVSSNTFVSFGKYHVTENMASVLRSIINKYGDIAVDCRLQSAVMRSHYLKCMCSVVQELKSTPFEEFTKSKIKEMQAVVKDVESVQIDASWLREILIEFEEAIELKDQEQVVEVEKASNDRQIVSIRKELKIMMADLAQKEMEVAGAKARVEKTRAQLHELQLKSSQLEGAIRSTKSKINNFLCKPLGEEIC